MEKILSIVIPTYNMEKYIGKCLKSLIIPEIDLLDILVINDGSKDASSQVAREIAKEYSSSIRVIDKENGNYGSCINKGLSIACGKYIKILDADDTFDTEVLSEFVRYLKESDADLVLSEFRAVNEEGVKIRDYSCSGLSSRGQLKVADLLPYISDIFLAMHAFTYKLSIFDGMGYKQSEGISYTDSEWIYLPMLNVDSIAYFKGSLYVYLIGREGQTRDVAVRRRQLSHVDKIVRWMVEHYVERRESTDESKRRYLEGRLLRSARAVYMGWVLGLDTIETNQTLIELDDLLTEMIPDLRTILLDTTELNPLRFKPLRYWVDNGRRAGLPLVRLRRLWAKMRGKELNF